MTRIIRLAVPLLAGLILALAGGCAIIPPVTPSQKYASAVTLTKDAEAQFVQTAPLYDWLINHGKITWDEYQKWLAFSARYQAESARINGALAALKGTAGDPTPVLTDAKKLAAELDTYYKAGVKASKS